MTNINKKIEEEFTRLGFDYENMEERAMYLRNDYALFTDQIKLKYNQAQNCQDEIHFEFGVDCITRGQPSTIQNMSVKLMRYGVHLYEGKELHFDYYHSDKRPFPTKEQVCNEMIGILKAKKIKERFNIGGNFNEQQHTQNTSKTNRRV